MTRDPFVVWSHRARHRDRFLPASTIVLGVIVAGMFIVGIVLL